MKKTCRPLSLAWASSSARAGSAVAARAAGLLVPGLERRRDADVGDGPHVRLVDAHAERVRRDDDVEVAVHEPPLHRRAALAGEARVVGARPRCRARRRGRWRRARTARACRRRRSPGAPPGRRAPRRGAPRRRPARGTGTTANVRFGPVEAGRDADRLAQAQAPLDVGGDLRRRGRGRRDDRLRAEPARRVGEAEVVGPEVVAPLRDAVRLVDDEEADRHLAQRLEEPGRGEALRRDVEQPQLAGARAVEHRAVGLGVLLGVDERDRAADAPLERLDLVLHQRDERRDDDRQVRAQQRGQLVAERLPGAGRHDDEHVAAGERAAPPPPPGRGGSRRSRRSRAARGGVHPSRPSTVAAGPARMARGSQAAHSRGADCPGAKRASGGAASLVHAHPAERPVAEPRVDGLAHRRALERHRVAATSRARAQRVARSSPDARPRPCASGSVATSSSAQSPSGPSTRRQARPPGRRPAAR